MGLFWWNQSFLPRHLAFLQSRLFLPKIWSRLDEKCCSDSIHGNSLFPETSHQLAASRWGEKYILLFPFIDLKNSKIKDLTQSWHWLLHSRHHQEGKLEINSTCLKSFYIFVNVNSFPRLNKESSLPKNSATGCARWRLQIFLLVLTFFPRQIDLSSTYFEANVVRGAKRVISFRRPRKKAFIMRRRTIVCNVAFWICLSSTSHNVHLKAQNSNDMVTCTKPVCASSAHVFDASVAFFFKHLGTLTISFLLALCKNLVNYLFRFWKQCRAFCFLLLPSLSFQLQFLSRLWPYLR